jgi:uncharacterized protein (TIGR00369 family)
MCLVCGLKNPLGLKAEFFELENNELVARFTPQNLHQGYPYRLHGGITAAILDEAIGRAIMILHREDVWAVTADFNIRFHKPIPLDEELKVVARITRDFNRLFEGSGEVILANGEVAASATGKYFKFTIKKISDINIADEEWMVVTSDRDPLKFDL